MRNAVHSLLSFFVCMALAVSAGAAGSRPVENWNYYRFNGTAFISGPTTDGSAFIAVREKIRPVVLTAIASPVEQTPLPDDAGVLAGICYVQSYGGKLGSNSGVAPCVRVPILISSGNRQLVTVLTDDNGYFVAVLPAGTYSVGSGPFTAEMTVERGITTLVPLRAGKRMVD